VTTKTYNICNKTKNVTKLHVFEHAHYSYNKKPPFYFTTILPSTAGIISYFMTKIWYYFFILSIYAICVAHLSVICNEGRAIHV